MAIIETKTYVCDCCDRKSESSDFNTGSICGAGTLKLNGSSGGMSYNGDWGGVNYNIEKLLCFSCVEKVKECLKSLSKEIETK